MLCVEFPRLFHYRLRIVVFPLPDLAVETQKSLLKALIGLLLEKPTGNSIDIRFQESPLGESENRNPSRHGLDGRDARILFLRHQETTSTLIDLRDFPVADTSQEFDILAGYFLKFFFLRAIADDPEIDPELGYHSHDPIDLLEWRQRAGEDIVSPFGYWDGTNQKSSGLHRWPEHDRIPTIVSLYPLLHLDAIRDIDIRTFRGTEIDSSKPRK